MCYAAPGPRCGPHAKAQWEKSSERLKLLRHQEFEISTNLNDALDDTSYSSEEEVDTLRQQQQSLRTKIDEQVDRVYLDRDSYRATSAGISLLKEEKVKAEKLKDFTKLGYIQKAYDKACSEYNNKNFAIKVTEMQKKNLAKFYPQAKPGDILKNMETQNQKLKEEESNLYRIFARNENKGTHDNSLNAKMKKAKKKRLEFQALSDARKAGCDSMLQPINPIQAQNKSHEMLFVSVSPVEFGVVQSYFPQGAIVQVTSISDGVATLITGHTQQLYKDTKFFVSDEELAEKKSQAA